GKSPVIVDDTADLELAARRLVMGKFINSGQTCIAPDYVLADEKIVGELIAQMKKYIVQFFGEDPQKSEDLSRIAAKRQFDRLIKVLNDGLEKGNEGEDEQKLIESYSGKGHILLWGGKSDEGDLYIEPTLLLAKIDSESQVMKEEIFGPLFPIIPVKSEGFIDTAISFINQRDKPLAMYGFTDNKKTKEKITNLTSSGSLSFNECLLQLANKELPFGGVGESGMGFYHGIFSFEAFSHLKSYMDKTKSFDIGTRYPPYNPSKLKLMKTIM
ncbi:MAG: Aldehyde dehydrogenase, partial [Streblomastix strix]